MSTRDRRAVLLGLLAVGTLWISLRGIPGLVREVRMTEARIEQEVMLLDRARTRLARLGELDDSIRVLEEAAEALPSMLLVGEDPETASVDLMRRSRQLVAPWPVRLEGFEATRPTTSASGLELAEVGIRLETDLRTLMDVLRAIEENPALGVEGFDIQATDAHAPPSQPERIAVIVRVSGWFRPDEQATDSPVEFNR